MLNHSYLIAIKSMLSGPVAWMLVGAAILWMYNITQLQRIAPAKSSHPVAKSTFRASSHPQGVKAQVMRIENGEIIALQVPMPSALPDVSTMKTCIVFRDLITSSSAMSCERDGDVFLQNDD